MGQEIERRFLVRDEGWRGHAVAHRSIEQFYLVASDGRTLRVRIVDEARAFLTLKAGEGIVRHEFEYEIPLADGRAMEALKVGEGLRKTRHDVPLGDWTVEVDVYSGALDGLVVAEIELGSPEDAPQLPAFLGQEITGDPRYSNARLALEGPAAFAEHR